MMTRISIMLDEKSAIALSKLARQEYREIRLQAAVLIRDELVRRGLLNIEDKQQCEITDRIHRKEKRESPPARAGSNTANTHGKEYLL